jgi:hypothetical protein
VTFFQLALAAIVIALAIVCVRCLIVRWQANHRADLLLSQLLSADDLHCLHTRGYLEVQSRSRPDRLYHIPAEPGLVSVIDAGVLSLLLCAQPRLAIPAAEEVLVHKLMLEGAESEYWRLANQFAMPAARWRSGQGQVMVWTGRPPGVLGQR